MVEGDMRFPWFEKLRAKLGGYFWLPCPVCGENFGGHEKPSGRLDLGPNGCWTTCSNCIEKALKLNDDYYNGKPVVIWK